MEPMFFLIDLVDDPLPSQEQQLHDAINEAIAPLGCKIRATMDREAARQYCNGVARIIEDANKTSTIYVVTSGEYSAYQIEGVFSTRELAERFVAELSSMRTPEIEEWELDRRKEQVCVKTFYTRIELRTGDITERGERKRLWVGNQMVNEYGNESESPMPNHNWYESHSRESQEHADKIAIEKRQAWLRLPPPEPPAPPENETDYEKSLRLARENAGLAKPPASSPHPPPAQSPCA